MGATDETCQLCGTSEMVTRLDRVPDYITGEEFQIRQCIRCGLEFTSPRPAAIAPYYPAAYRRYAEVASHTLQLLYGAKVRGWLRRLPRPGRALEVGCGAGWMLRTLRDRGWHVLGSERTFEDAAVGATAHHIPMFVGDFEAISPSARFDLIILFQVLEHLAAPVDMLRRSAAVLGQRGVLVVAVPNPASWQARVFGRSWFHLDTPRHQHYFSPGTLAAALESVGLRVVRTRFVSFEHDPYGWVQSALNRLGFRQNLLTRVIMGLDTKGAGVTTLAPMMLLAGVLVVPAVVLSVCSWVAGAGAIVEMWAVPMEKSSLEAAG